MRVLLILCAFAVLAIGRLANADMLPNLRSTEVIEGRAVAMAGNVLTINQRTIYLFGIDVPPGNAPQAAAARQALDVLLSSAPIRCNALRSWFRGVLAICNASDGNDLAVTLLRAGAVVVSPSQAFASTVEAAYVAAESNAQEAGIGLWGTTTRPSSSPQEALDRVAVALATPPDPVPTGSFLWYLYPWQGAVAGFLGLIGAAFVLMSTNHQVKTQLQIINMQIREEKESKKIDRNNRKIGILYRYLSYLDYLIDHSGALLTGYENVERNKWMDNANIVTEWKTGPEIGTINIPGAFEVSPDDFVNVGYEIGVKVDEIRRSINVYNIGFETACTLDGKHGDVISARALNSILRKAVKDVRDSSIALQSQISADIESAVSQG